MALFGLGLLIAPLAAGELSTIFEANRIMTRRWLTALAAMLGLALSYSVPMQTEAIGALSIVPTGMILTFVAALLTFSRQRNGDGVVAAAGGVGFALGQEVRGDQPRVGGSVGDDHYLPRACQSVDADLSVEVFFGGGDPTVSRSDDNIAGWREHPER